MSPSLFTMWMPGMLLLFLLAATFLGGSASRPPYIPYTWEQMCEENISSSSSGSSQELTVVQLTCSIPKTYNLHWKLNDLRQWQIAHKINQDTGAANRSTVYNITVTCQTGANVSLPWPMKVAGLQELRVTNCLMVDRYLNYKDPITASLPDEIKTLILRHGSWVIGDMPSISISPDGSLNVTSDYDCGQDETLVILITSNISDTFENALDSNFSFLASLGLDVSSASPDLPNEPVDQTSSSVVKPETQLIKDAQKVVSDQTDLTAEQDISKLPKGESDSSKQRDAALQFQKTIDQVFNTNTKCDYKKLKLMDESLTPLTPLDHFEFIVQGAKFPVLEVMNYSSIGLMVMPRELTQWRRYFPRLKLLDLRYNHIFELKFISNFLETSNVGVVTFDLRNNNISVINLEILKSWSEVENLKVDIRDNPIDCGCDMLQFLPHLHDQATFTGAMALYEYVKFLTCKTPEALAGQELYSLTEESIHCVAADHVYQTAALISVSVVMFLLIVTIILIVRFKVEIRILLYTRLHIRLPCDADAQRNLKTYDAFVSYSNDDAAWVYENLLKFLENPQSKGSDSHLMNGNANHNNNNKIKNNSNNNNKSDRDKSKVFKLCIHQRDFIPGKTIFDNIVDSIERSRHTIIVLSPSFMRSHWAMEELRQAYRQSLVEKTRHLIVLLLEKVPKEEMDPLISRCCKTFTYLDVADSLFKDRLVFSLTTKDRSAKRRDKLAAKENQGRLHKSPSTVSESVYDSVQYSPYSSPTSTPECVAYDNVAYSHYVGRPAEPVRELSNMSTSSTAALTSY